ncbi:hypothetical protein, conserved, partial [Eimeria maxima]
MCEGVTAEELLNPMQEAQEQPGSNQTMKFTYKRRLFASPNKVQELIVPASIRAVKVNRFSTGSLQVYCADERGNIRLWDLAKVQERSLLESSRSCSPRPGHEDLRLSSETEEEPSPRHGRATISAKFRRGVMANRRRTFLTQPTPEWPSETDDEHHDLSAMRKRRDGTKVTRPKKRFLEVTLLHESSGHDDAVLSLDLCEAGTTPEAVATEDKSGRAEYHRRWILSVGADRVVKAWSLDLKRLGQLTSVSYGEQQANSLSNGLQCVTHRADGQTASQANDWQQEPGNLTAPFSAMVLMRNPLTSSQIEAATKFEQVGGGGGGE